MQKSEIIGLHNADLQSSVARLKKTGYYKDLSTVMIMPNLGSIPTQVVSSWMSLMSPPNQKVVRLFPTWYEVGAAYEKTIESILAHPELSQYKYILTIEADNAPPIDGFVKLLESAEAHPEYAVIGGLYWTKGEGGVPQIWGDPMAGYLNFRPMPPKPGQLVECCGTGMGFNLFRLEMFKDPKLRKPWFETKCEVVPGQGAQMYTQDLWFATDAKANGYRFAIDCRVLVGHYESSTGIMW